MNTRWAKLYTQVDSQMLVTITPSKNGFLVEKKMMVNGVMKAVLCYDGGDKKFARNVFEGITRDDVSTTISDIHNGVEEKESAPDVKEEGTVGPNPDGEHFQEEKFTDIAVTLKNIGLKEGVRLLHVTIAGKDDSTFLWNGKELFSSTEMKEDVYKKHNKKKFLIVPIELGSWASCMGKKITKHYGPEVADCTKGITHGNWEKILECMVTVLGITDPVTWIPEQIAFFTVWSAECIFD